jgi:hypothetical protein
MTNVIDLDEPHLKREEMIRGPKVAGKASIRCRRTARLLRGK